MFVKIYQKYVLYALYKKKYTKKHANMPNFFTLIGLATNRNHRGYKAYLASAEKHGVNTNVVGLDQAWGGWKWRTQQYIKTLSTLEGDDMVGVMDTYDVLVAGSGYKMYDIYMKLVGNDTGKIVFGMEKYNGRNTYGDVNDDGGLPNVNAGCCFGRVDILRKIWKRVSNTYDKINSLDDQFTLGYLLTNDPEIRSLVVFDSRSALITNVTAYYASTINSVHELNTPILHFPGGLLLSGNLVKFYNHYMR